MASESVINVKVGTRVLPLNIEETRALFLQTGYAAKAFGLKPKDVLDFGLKFRSTTPADLDMSKSLNELGYHLTTSAAGEGGVVGEGALGNDLAQTILLTHLNNSTPVTNFPVGTEPPNVTTP